MYISILNNEVVILTGGHMGAGGEGQADSTYISFFYLCQHIPDGCKTFKHFSMDGRIFDLIHIAHNSQHSAPQDNCRHRTPSFPVASSHHTGVFLVGVFFTKIVIKKLFMGVLKVRLRGRTSGTWSKDFRSF